MSRKNYPTKIMSVFANDQTEIEIKIVFNKYLVLNIIKHEDEKELGIGEVDLDVAYDIRNFLNNNLPKIR